MMATSQMLQYLGQNIRSVTLGDKLTRVKSNTLRLV